MQCRQAGLFVATDDRFQPISWGTVETAGPLVSDQTIVFASSTPATNGFYRVVAELP